MPRNKTSLVFSFVIVCFFLNCTGPTGPTGLTGPMGPQGIPGPGAREITFSMAFTAQKPYADNAIGPLNGSMITDICVKLPSGLGSEYWTPLPYTVFSPGHIPVYLQSTIIYYSFPDTFGEIRVDIKRADNQNGWPFIDSTVSYDFKALLIKKD